MRVLSQDESRLRAHRAGVPWRVGEALAWRECLRAQLAAEGAMTRRSLVDRALRWADAPRGEEDRERLYALIEDLDAVGDLALGADGLVGATPPRIAVVHGTETVLLLGTVPTPVFARALGVAVEARKVRRVVLPRRDAGSLASAAASLGGRVTDAARWTGMDRSPASPNAWWDELHARQPIHPDAALEWNSDDTQRLLLSDGRGRWREGASGSGLLRLRADGGWHRFALRSADGALHALTRDEALRTELALRSVAGALTPVAPRMEAGAVRFTLAERIPRAEYRLLLGTADRAEAMVWDAPLSAWPALASVFRDRLGWAVDESGLLRGEPP